MDRVDPKREQELKLQVEKLLKNLGPKEVDIVLSAILETSVPSAVIDDHEGFFVGHDHDDGREEEGLEVSSTPNGDMWIRTIHRMRGGSLCFRMPIVGGGRRPHVFAALRILALAMSLDNPPEKPEEE